MEPDSGQAEPSAKPAPPALAQVSRRRTLHRLFTYTRSYLRNLAAEIASPRSKYDRDYFGFAVFGLLLRTLADLRPITAVTFSAADEREDAWLEAGGSQVWRTMMAMDFARQAGIAYVHTPFRMVGHPETAMPEWAARWENLFDLGRDEVAISGWRGRTPVNFNLIFGWDLQRLYGLPVTGRVSDESLALCQAKYRRNNPPRRNPVHEVAVHIRRNEVTPERYSELWVEEEVPFRTLSRVIALLESRSQPFRIGIYCQDANLDIARFAAHGARLHAEMGAIETIQAMIEADTLVSTKSGFSYLAGLFSDGVKIAGHPAFAEPGWIVIDETGNFDEAEYLRQLAASTGSAP